MLDLSPPIRLLLALVLLAAPLAGCLQSPAADVEPAAAEAAPALDEDGLAPAVFGATQFLTFQAESATGRIVHAEAWIPDVASFAGEGEAPAAFPTILVASPYWGAGTGGDVISYEPYAYWIEKAIPRGYAVVFGDNAGNGGSGGCWDFMGPEEQAATVALVEGIAAQPWSDGKVGMIGISYDGMTQIMAASQNAPHLTTVVPVAPLTHAYAGLYMNGVHYGGGWWSTTTGYTASSVEPPATLGAGPAVHGAERLPGWAERMAQTPACAGQNAAMGNDPTGAYNAYYEARDFRPFAKDVNASVFFIQGFLDPAVKPDNAFPWSQDVRGAKKAWLGHWFHQFPTAAASGREDMYLTIHRWFDHELKGIPNGILDEPAVDVQDSQGRWRTEAEWPPADANATAFHLNSDGLARAPGTEGAASVGGADAIGQTARLHGTFEVSTGPLDAPLHVAGIPFFNATVTSDRAGGQLIVRAVDVAPDGTERLVTQGAQNLLVARDPAAAQPLAPGEAVPVGFHLYPTDYLVPAGHALVVRLYAQETSPLGWFTPDPTLARLTVRLGGEDGARLTLPLVERPDDAVFLVACGTPLRNAVDGCYDEDRDDKGVGN